MRNAILLCFTVIVFILIFKLGNDETNQDEVFVEFDDVQTDSPSLHRNCSLPSCFDLQRCILNYEQLNVFIEPLIKVQQKSITISPVPSKEFLEIRKAFLPYSVDNVEEACIVIPGIDFLNLNRFHSNVWAGLLSAVREKYHNALIFNFMGLSEGVDPLIAGSLLPKSVYRSEFDISIPFLLPKGIRSDKQKSKISKVLIPVSSSFTDHQKYASIEDHIFIYSCSPPSLLTVCDSKSRLMEKTLIDYVEESVYVMITENFPYVEALLSLSLSSGSVPIIILPNHVLPFSELIDWRRIAVLPMMLSRVNELLSDITQSEVSKMGVFGRETFSNFFSSATDVAEKTYSILERRILPTKYVLPMNQIMPLVSHVSLSNTTNIIQISENIEDAQFFNSYCSFEELSSMNVIWVSSDDPPDAQAFDCGARVSVRLGVSSWAQLRDLLLHMSSESIILVKDKPCDVLETSLRKTFNIWKTNPESLVELRSDPSCNPFLFVHRFYLLFLTNLRINIYKNFDHLAKNLRRIEVYEKNIDIDHRSGSALVLI